MLGIPNLNEVYKDDLCTVYIHDVYGDNSLLVVHVDVVKSTKREIIQHYFDVIEGLFDALRAKGVPEIEAWVSSDEEIKFAQFYGFDQFLGELMVNGQSNIPPIFRLKKDLT